MNEKLQSVLDSLVDRFKEAIVEITEDREQTIVRITKDSLVPILKYLKEEASPSFPMLIDITALDMSELRDQPRFDVVYQLYSFDNLRLRLKVGLNDGESVASATSLWKVADCLEREVYDMFGIRFEGHPNLKRILLPETFEHYPLRKKYPVKGLGERDNFRKVERL